MKSEKDQAEFLDYWSSVRNDIYDKPISSKGLVIVYETLQRFEFEQIKRAVQIHMNSDSGEYAVTPAHVVKIIEGRTEELAARAYERLMVAISSVGPYDDIVFDDPALHAIIRDEGGWVDVCNMPVDQLPYFKARFLKLYQALKNRRVFDYPKMLTGITNAENSVKKDEHGKSPEKLPPTVIGDKELAKQVYLGGQERGQQIAFSADAVLQATNKLLVKHDDKP